MLLFVTSDVIQDRPLRHGPDREADEPTRNQYTGGSKQDGQCAITPSQARAIGYISFPTD